MRHIKIKAELSPCTTKAYLTILEQTHFGKEFGDTENGVSFTPPTGSIKLFSSSEYGQDTDEEDEEDPFEIHIMANSSVNGARGHTLFVNGVDARDVVDYYEIDATLWPEIKAAVEYYNEYYKEE